MFALVYYTSRTTRTEDLSQKIINAIGMIRVYSRAEHTVRQRCRLDM